MKKNGKRLLACFAALAVSCSMISGFAAGTSAVEITKIQVLEDESAPIDITNVEDKSLTPEQMLEVTLRLTDGADPATVLNEGQISFLSYKEGQLENLSDATIQYIDQKNVPEDAPSEVVVTFRPRYTGAFVAKVGGTDATSATFNYTVEGVTPTLTLTASDATAVIGATDDNVEFTVDATEDAELPASIEVYIDGSQTALTADGYTYVSASGSLVINNAVLGDVAGTHNVVVKATDYIDSAAANYTLSNSIVDPELPDDQVGAAQDALNDITHNIVKDEETGAQTVTLTSKVTVGETEVTINNTPVTAVTNDPAISIVGNTITYTPNTPGAPFVSKVTVTSTINVGDGASITKNIYFVPDNTIVNFGNFTAIATENGADAFATDEGIAAASEDDKNIARIEALNIALGRQDLDSVLQSENTIDYDQDGKFVLAEYRIIKLMYEGENELYKVEALKEAREEWLKTHSE